MKGHSGDYIYKREQKKWVIGQTCVLSEMDPLVRAAQLNLNPTAAAFAFEFPPTPGGQELQSLSSRQDILQVGIEPITF